MASVSPSLAHACSTLSLCKSRSNPGSSVGMKYEVDALERASPHPKPSSIRRQDQIRATGLAKQSTTRVLENSMPANARPGRRTRVLSSCITRDQCPSFSRLMRPQPQAQGDRLHPHSGWATGSCGGSAAARHRHGGPLLGARPMVVALMGDHGTERVGWRSSEFKGRLPVLPC